LLSFIFLYPYRYLRDLHAFPTRRSSDLFISKLSNVHLLTTDETFIYKNITFAGNPMWYPLETPSQIMFFNNISNDSVYIKNFDRSEEHTSELQSRENLVCRLLLEKKK